MKDIEDIQPKYILITAFLALLCAFLLRWFENNAMTIQSGVRLQRTNENLVSCSTNSQTANERSKDDKQVPDRNNDNGCSHSLTGSLCPTNKAKRRGTEQNRSP